MFSSKFCSLSFSAVSYFVRKTSVFFFEFLFPFDLLWEAIARSSHFELSFHISTSFEFRFLPVFPLHLYHWKMGFCWWVAFYCLCFGCGESPFSLVFSFLFSQSFRCLILCLRLFKWFLMTKIVCLELISS